MCMVCVCECMVCVYVHGLVNDRHCYPKAGRQNGQSVVLYVYIDHLRPKETHMGFHFAKNPEIEQLSPVCCVFC